MTHQELKNLLLNKIKETGQVPRTLTLEDGEYIWSGGQRIGMSRLYRYRKSGIDSTKEKQIMLPC